MVLLDNDGFLSGLTKLFHQTKTTGTVFLTMKKFCGQTKCPRGGFKKKKRKPTDKASGRKAQRKAHSPEPEENLCLLRATNGKKKLSTVVSAKEVTRFQLAYANLLKGNMDGLKKRDKKTAKAAAAKDKKRKATTA